MVPPTQTLPQRTSQSSSRQREKAPADLAVKVKYQNTLPDIPFDAKFVGCPFVNVDRFVPYKPTSLERNHKWDIVTQPDLGINVDLIDIDKYQIDMSSRLEKETEQDPVDAALMEEDQPVPTETKRQMQHRMVLPWMRKTDYISAENRALGTAPSGADRQETRIGFGLRRRLLKESQAEGLPSSSVHDDSMLRDVKTQIRAIEQTFEDGRKEITRHPTKKGVTAIEMLPLLPDFELWKHPFAQVQFDSDPRPSGAANPAASLEQMSSAMIRGMMDESGEQFVAYFLPGEQAISRLRVLKETDEEVQVDEPQDPDDPEDKRPVYEYQLTREYNWKVQNKGKGFEQENYCLVLRSGRMLYNALDTRVKLTRRRVKDTASNRSRRTKLVVKRRDETENERDQQMRRLNELLKAPADDEEEAEPAEADEAAAAAEDSDDNAEPKAEQQQAAADSSGDSDAPPAEETAKRPTAPSSSSSDSD